MRLVYLLCFVSMSFLLFSQSYKEEDSGLVGEINEQTIFKGKIKEVYQHEFNAEFKFGKIIKTDTSFSGKFVFNKSGKILEQSVFNLDTFKIVRKYDEKDSLLEKFIFRNDDTYEGVTYKYNSNGNPIERVYFKNSKTPTSKIILKYDMFNNHTETLYYGFDNDERKDVYKYNDQNKIIEEILFLSNKISGKVTYSYNLDGNISEIFNYDSDGKLWSKRTQKYSSNGEIIESCFYDGQGKFVQVNDSFYFDNGNILSRTSYSYTNGQLLEENYFNYRYGEIDSYERIDYKYLDGNLYETIRTTNNKATITKFYPNNKIKEQTNYYNGNKIGYFKFDELGNHLESVEYIFNGELSSKRSFLYEYDSNGNWIKLTFFKYSNNDDIPKIFIVERNIVYYD